MGDDELGESLIKTPKPRRAASLTEAVVEAAQAAFKKANVEIPTDHAIYTDLKDYARGKRMEGKEVKEVEPGSKVSYTVGIGYAKAFVRYFNIELKKNPELFDEFTKKMSVVSRGPRIVIAKKAELPGIKAAFPEEMVLREALQKAARAANLDLSSEEMKSQINEFVRGYREWLKVKKERSGEHLGATLAFPGLSDKASAKFVANLPRKRLKAIGVNVESKDGVRLVVARYVPTGEVKFSQRETKKREALIRTQSILGL